MSESSSQGTKRDRQTLEAAEPSGNRFDAFFKKIPTHADDLLTKMNEAYPILTTSFRESPYHYGPAMDVLPPKGTDKDGLLKYGILTLAVLCKLTNLPPPPSDLVAQTDNTLARATGLPTRILTTLSNLQKAEVVGLKIDFPKLWKALTAFLLVTPAGKYAQKGTFWAITELYNVYLQLADTVVGQHLLANKYAYGATIYLMQVIYSILASHLASRRERETAARDLSLFTVCQRSYEALCTRDNVKCSRNSDCEKAYRDHYSIIGVNLGVYLKLPETVIAIYDTYALEFQAEVDSQRREEYNGQVNVTEQVTRIDKLVKNRFENVFINWEMFVKNVPWLADEVGLLGSLLFYQSADEAWLRFLSSFLRCFCRTLYEDDADKAVNIGPENTNMSYYQPAIRSIIVALACNPADTLFQRTFGEALSREQGDKHRNTIDVVTEYVEGELLAKVAEVESRPAKKARTNNSS